MPATFTKTQMNILRAKLSAENYCKILDAVMAGGKSFIVDEKLLSEEIMSQIAWALNMPKVITQGHSREIQG